MAKQPASRRPYRLLLILPLLLALGYVLFRGVQAARYGLAALDRLQRLEEIARGDPVGLVFREGLAPVQRELAGLHTELAGLQRYAGGALKALSHLAWLPALGPNLRAAPHLLQMGIELSYAGERACLAAQPILDDFLGKSASSEASLLERVSEQLAAQQADWARAQQAAERAIAARERFSAEGLHPRLAGPLAQLDALLPWLRAGMTGAVVAPELLGASGPRRYLVLAQNSDELRPTGGYISGIGLLTLEQGRIAGLSFADSYAVDDLTADHPDPPAAMREHMGIDLWLTKDANWFPDFPASAKACADLYYLDQETAVDGVVAADLVALQMLVEAVGPLRLEGYAAEIDGSNVLAEIQSYWAPKLRPGQTWEEWEATPWEIRKREWFDERKDFMPDLVDAIMERVMSDPGALDAPKLAATIKRILDEKHALIFFYDPTAQGMVTALGWDGAVRHPDHDYLMVVDTNVGYTKVNGKIAQRIAYRVEIADDGTAQGRVDLAYKNTATRDLPEGCVKDMSYDPTYELMTQRCYWDYVRVYAPAGSQLVSSQSVAAVGALVEEVPHAIWDTSLVLAPREEAALSFTYRLPAQVLRQDKSRVYNLLVQKQPGTDAVPLLIEVQLPPGARLVSAQPAPSGVEGNLIRFRTDLREDRKLQVVFEP